MLIIPARHQLKDNHSPKKKQQHNPSPNKTTKKTDDDIISSIPRVFELHRKSEKSVKNDKKMVQGVGTPHQFTSKTKENERPFASVVRMRARA